MSIYYQHLSNDDNFAVNMRSCKLEINNNEYDYYNTNSLFILYPEVSCEGFYQELEQISSKNDSILEKNQNEYSYLSSEHANSGREYNAINKENCSNFEFLQSVEEIEDSTKIIGGNAAQNAMSNSKDQITFPNSQSPIPIYNKSGTIRKKIGRKREHTGLRNRKDVVLKTLLRKIHNHFWKDLNSETKYYKHKRNRGSLYYERCLRNYIENKLVEVASKDFMFIFGSIVSHSDTEQLIIKSSTNLFGQEESENLLKQIKDIHQIMYKFSVSKFSILSRRPEMLNLILQFEKVKRSCLNRDENIGIQILINECIKNIY